MDTSPIIYGTWRTLDRASTATVDSLAKCLRACLDHGVTTIDTAQIYGDYKVEELLGATLQSDSAFMNQFEIISKSGIHNPGASNSNWKVAHYDATGDRIIQSVENSLKLLGLEQLDMYLVHRPDWLTPADDTARGLDHLLSTGKIKACGVSNYNVHQFAFLNRLLKGRLETNQIELSLFHLDPIFDGTLEQLQEFDLKAMAWSPLGGGKLFDSDDSIAVRVRHTMEPMALKYDAATFDQLAYAWIAAIPASPVPVIGTAKIERIKAAALSANINLEREDWYALTAAVRGGPIP